LAALGGIELSITNFNQIEIEKAVTVKMAGIIWLCMQKLSLFILKLGAIPPPILATIALMEESHNGDDRTENAEETSDSVDIEHMVRDQKNCCRSNTKEQKRPTPDFGGTDYGVYFGT
jgi:hypothetical protein